MSRETIDHLREGNIKRHEKVYIMLSGIFLAALVLTNLIAGKFFVFMGKGLSSGVIIYPVTFLVTDLISELYGEKRATLLVKTGFLVSVFVTIVIIIASNTVIDPNSPVDEGSFNTVFGLLPGIVFGSMIAYLSAQFVDIKLYEFWRKLTGGKHLWLRNNGSTILSQLVDTVTVVTVALVIWPMVDQNEATTAISMDTWWQYCIWQYLFKAMIALFDTPLMYLFKHQLETYIKADPLLKK